jgi:hypothetical protein
MLMARKRAEAADLKARTCDECGGVKDAAGSLITLTTKKDLHAVGARLCWECWETVPDVVEAEESVAV